MQAPRVEKFAAAAAAPCVEGAGIVFSLLIVVIEFSIADRKTAVLSRC